MDNQNNKLRLEDLGWDDFFEAGRAEMGFGGFVVARVAAEYRELYRVKNQNGEYLAKITGKLLFRAVSREDYPAVGDWAVIDEINNEQAVIVGVLLRKTMIERKSCGKSATQIIAANVDAAFVVQAMDGDYSLNRFERYFSICRGGGVEPVIVLNKIDLISKEELESKISQIKNRFGKIHIIAASAMTDSGLDELKKYIQAGKTHCFLGSSGVGKSTLINKLIGQETIKTNDISEGTDRGRHTTTGREMHILKDGGIVIDNPGMREVGVANADAGIDDAFAQIAELAKECKYTDCTHAREPGCAVLAAVESGELDKEKYDNYISLKKEADYYELDKIGKREKDRQFGKFIKRVKDQLKKSGHH